jgi:hypothetical protein
LTSFLSLLMGVVQAFLAFPFLFAKLVDQPSSPSLPFGVSL